MLWHWIPYDQLDILYHHEDLQGKKKKKEVIINPEEISTQKPKEEDY